MGIVYLAALFVIGGVSLALWALKPEPKVVAIGLDPEDVVPTSRELELQGSFLTRVVNPLAQALAARFGRYLPSGMLEATAKTLRVADLDKRWRPEVILAMQAGGFVLGMLGASAYLSSSGASRTNLLVAGLMVVLLTMAPDAKIKRMADDLQHCSTE